MHQLACYGFITCFDADDKVCQACDDIKSCQKACYEALTHIDSAIGDVSALQKKHERWARRLDNKIITTSKVRENFQIAEEDFRIQGLNKNALEVAKTMLHHEFNPVKIARSGENTFYGVTPKYLGIIAEHVSKKKFTTRGLIDDLKDKLQWSETTAKTYASACIEVLASWKTITRIKRGEYEVKI